MDKKYEQEKIWKKSKIRNVREANFKSGIESTKTIEEKSNVGKTKSEPSSPEPNHFSFEHERSHHFHSIYLWEY